MDITSAWCSKRRSRSAEATLPLAFPSAAFIYCLGYEVWQLPTPGDCCIRTVCDARRHDAFFLFFFPPNANEAPEASAHLHQRLTGLAHPGRWSVRRDSAGKKKQKTLSVEPLTLESPHRQITTTISRYYSAACKHCARHTPVGKSFTLSRKMFNGLTIF